MTEETQAAPKQATLAECNALLLRQALPLTFGTEEEQKAALKAEGKAEQEALQKAKILRREREDAINAIHAREFERHAREAGVDVAPAPTVTAEEQAALDVLAALTNPQT